MVTAFGAYYLVGLVITVITWPFLKKVWFQRDNGSNFAQVLLASFLWPFSVLASAWLGVNFYKNYWIEHFMLQERSTAKTLRVRFDEKWQASSPEDRIKYTYEAQKQEVLSRIQKLEHKSADRFYYLEEQARKGLWFNPLHRPNR